MKRALLIVVALALAPNGVASAGTLPAGIVTPPAGWTETAAPPPTAVSPELGTLTATAYQSDVGQAVLYVTRREVAATEATRNQLATTELVQQEILLAGHGKDAVTDLATKRADRTEQQLELRLQWHDDAMGLDDHSRTIVAATEGTIVAITGECVASHAVPATVTAACATALDSLQIDLAGEVRVALAIAGHDEHLVGPPTTAPTTDQLEPPPALGASTPSVIAPSEAPRVLPTAPLSAAPSMAPADDRAHFGPIVFGPPSPPPSDRRPLFIGAGLVLFAILLYWNKQRRERFEREDGRPVRKPRSERRRNRDDDADDLHAAAAEPSDTPEDDAK